MAEVKQDLTVPQPVGFLEVSLTAPRMSGFAGPAWPRLCTMYVAIGDEVVAWEQLPVEFDREDFKRWRLPVRVPVTSDWTLLSLDIFVERADAFLRRRRTDVVVVARGGPHTSRHTAVISRARVRLLDALVLGDMDDDAEEEEKKMKRRRNEVAEGKVHPRLMEGTMPFGKAVQLLDWELPALGDEYANPRAVVRGTVDVRINLLRPPFFR